MELQSPSNNSGEDTDNGKVSIRYMPQLDTLRTFAVFFVLIQHWLSERTWLTATPFGMIGVTLFFVLSGFLITQILLQGKFDSANKHLSLFHLLKQFYIRRTLRIFPIYYITIFILFIINFQNIREIFLWFLFYASNIYFYLINDWAGSASHLWTLAVEEQFYIFWPFIILFTPKKYLLKIMAAIILIGPVTRIIFYSMSDKTEFAVSMFSILTPTCMDCFGLGGLLAYLRVFVNPEFKLNSKAALIFLSANIIYVIFLYHSEESYNTVIFYRFNVSVICLFIISKASIGFTGILKNIFQNKALMFLGKISYGLYLFHKFIPYIYNLLKLPPIENIYSKFIVNSVLLILISTLSWFAIEKPINSLKSRFKYT